jgi:glutathione S-transferase
MRLLISTTSPFARKCRIVAREKGLIGRVEEVVVDPYANDVALVDANPIVQVPALIDDQGVVFTNSPLICAYFDEIGEGPRLVADSGARRWAVQRAEVRADAVLEMAVKLILETRRRPENEQSPTWIERWRNNLHRALDVCEAECPPADALDLGSIATAATMTWLDFRYPDLAATSNRPHLAALQQALEQRDSFSATLPA